MTAALPALTIALVGYALLYGCCIAVGRLLAQRVEWRGRVMRVRLGAWLPRVIRVSGVVVFGVIWIADERASAELVAHEWRHVEQERALAYLGYLPMYFLRFALAGSYMRHPMEIDARSYARTHAHEFPAVPVR